MHHFVHHLAAECVFGFVNPRRVDEHDLRIVAIDNALNAIASGLRLGRDDGYFSPDQRVHQGGLAGVRAANDSDESRFECHGNILREASRNFRTDVMDAAIPPKRFWQLPSLPTTAAAREEGPRRLPHALARPDREAWQ